VYSISSKSFVAGDDGVLSGIRTVEVAFREGRFEEIAGTEREWKADLVLLSMGFLGPEHEVALFTIARNLQRRVDFTRDRAALQASVDDIVLDSGAGTVLLDGIRQTWERHYEGDETLPVMVLILTNGRETSRNYNDTAYRALVESLIAQGVMVNVLQLSASGGSIRGGNISTMPGYARNIASNTGGVYETITTATGMPEWLRRYAERLNAHYAEVSKRYRVLYEPPDPRGAQISAGARPGVNIRLFVDLRMEQ